MAAIGWRRLLVGEPWFRGEGKYPIPAYSEFMPAPRMGPRAYGDGEPLPCSAGDPYGWEVSEHEEESELAPGMSTIAGEIVHAVRRLGEGHAAHGIAQAKLDGNRYWPKELRDRAGRLAHERYVVLLPVALSRTQDDKGRVRWTLFGGSEQGPERAFWKGFFTAPDEERPAVWARGFFGRLIASAYGETAAAVADLHRLGLRIKPADASLLPPWARFFVLRDDEPLEHVKYLVTFLPFGDLPAGVRAHYFDGRLHLLPFPGSLVFFGAPPFARLAADLPFADQIPLLQACPRHEDPHGIRIPQSGWMHEPRDDDPVPGPHHEHHGRVHNTYRRTHRFARIHRHEDELAVTGAEDKVAHVLFSNDPDELELYGKPMARNAQIWTHDYRLLLDGPRADLAHVLAAAKAIKEGGLFGYRFIFPAMRVGGYEIYLHRPVAAFVKDDKVVTVPEAPPGWITCYRADRPDLAKPIELWPRMLARDHHIAAARAFPRGADRCEHVAALNARKVLGAARLLGRPLPRDFARALLTAPKEMTLSQWLDSHREAVGETHGRAVADALADRLAPETPVASKESVTYARTATRRFETAYWRTIAALASKFVNKENADCVIDPPTQAALKRKRRDLDALGDHLLDYYRRAAARAGMSRRVLVGDLPFRWETEFEMPWSGGWAANRDGKTEERDIVVVIPGRDRSRAVVLGDHYDTAYMEDRYDPPQGNRARLAAAGADDNHSATAALMLAAPIFFDLSRTGRLTHDVWLVHLTGEEFPSDCLGARHLSRLLVEGTLALRVDGRRRRDLSNTRVVGVYVCDMIAHNNERDSDVFQIAPGAGPRSLDLALEAQRATAVWNACVPDWNARTGRAGAGRGRRSADPKKAPAVALHPRLHGEVRPPADPRSALYNTDGQVFSDAGVPVVLFMENYDISRRGYHDTHDTMENIDLDYGAAVAAIAIESTARVACGRAEEAEP